LEDKYFKGRGAQINLANPFGKTLYVAEHIEGLDEPLLENPQRQILVENARKVVNKLDSPDLNMYYSVNPYQGCEHGCIYCYARNSHQYYGYSAGLDFETKIIVKKNAPQLLEKELMSRAWKVAPVSLSGNTDCYQPIEKEFKLTRQILQVLLRFGNPVGIISKNSMVIRDIDILKDLAAERLIQVFISLTSLDNKVRLKLEPRTATAANRLKVIEQLANADIPVGVMIAPIIPSINLHEVPAIIEAAANAGAITAGYNVVRLNGSIGEIFKDWLYKNYPDRAEKVWNQICELHGGKVNDSNWGRRMKGEGHLAQAISLLFNSARKIHMPQKMPELNLNAFRRGGELRLF
jgi:DNA repair photolyase